MSLPVPARWQVKSARLVLDFTYSGALVATRSQLRVQVNGVTLAQWRLDPRSARRLETVSIPPELLVAGYNELRFSVAQHYTEDQCEANASPELWTEIDPLKSHVWLEYTLVNPRLSLAFLGDSFDKKLPQAQVTLLFPELALDEWELSVGSLIAQGIGLRLEYAPFSLALAEVQPRPGSELLRLTLPQGQDSVLVGTRERLAPFLDPKLLSRITGPYLGLFADPKAPERVLLIVSGRNPGELRQAALAFALMRFPLPDAQETVIAEANFRQFQPYEALPVLQPNHTYTLSQLGFATTSRQGLDPAPIEFAFYLPPDAFAPEDAEVAFLLHLAYNAGMRQDSLLEMRINGVFERAIQLPEAGGAHYRDYRIQVPLRTFRPGRNQVSFHPLLVPAISGECLWFQTEQLKVTLYQDSRLTLPLFSRAVQLPELALLAESGFPYLDSGDGSGTGVYLLDRSPDAILAAWQLLAQLARYNRLPLPQVRLGFTEPTEPLDLIVIGGRVKKLPALFQNAPLELGDPFKTFPYPAGWKTPPSRPWWQQLILLRSPATEPILPRPVTMTQTGGLGEFAAALSFQHPAFPGKLVTAFVAEKAIYPEVQALTRPELWSQLKGELTLWRKGDRTVSWQAASEQFYRGSAPPSLRLIFHFTHHPWQWLAAALGACLALAWLVHRLLKRYQQRHHPDAKEVAP